MRPVHTHSASKDAPDHPTPGYIHECRGTTLLLISRPLARLAIHLSRYRWWAQITHHSITKAYDYDTVTNHMARITIPADQVVRTGGYVTIIIDNRLVIGIPLAKGVDRTSSASYDTHFDSDNFIPGVHGFTGITDQLRMLCDRLK